MQPITVSYDACKSLASEIRIIADKRATNGKRKRIVQRPFLGKYQLTVGEDIIAITSDLQTAVEAFNTL